MSWHGDAGHGLARLTNNLQPPPTSKQTRQLYRGTTFVPIMGNIHTYQLNTPPCPHPVVDCSDLVNDATFLDQYGARMAPLQNILWTPSRPKQYMMRKLFGLPNHMKCIYVEGEQQIMVRSLTDEPVQVRVDHATPWAPLMIGP